LHGKPWQKRLLPVTYAMEEMLLQQEPNVKEEEKAGGKWYGAAMMGRELTAPNKNIQ